MRIVAVALALSVAAIPAAADGSSAPELFKRFGLFGTWAANCARPASPDNPYVEISQPSPAEIIEQHDLGDSHEVNRYSVLSAEQLSESRLKVTVLLHPGADDEERQTLVFRVRDNTRRTLFNQPEGGPVRVKNGLVVGHELETPLLHKCK